MKITAKDLLELGLIERVIPEEEPVSGENISAAAMEMDKAMEEFFLTYLLKSKEELANQRYERFRRM